MFGIFKRKETPSECWERQEMDRIQQTQESFDTLLAEHRVQFDSAMESSKKASNLMTEVFSFVITQASNKPNSAEYEQAKNKLMSCLVAVQEDESLKGEQEVQELVDDIYKSMDDVGSMVALTSRLKVLVGTPKTPDILTTLNINF